MTEKLTNLFELWSGETVKSITQLPASGSYRIYYRIIGENKHCLGVYNNDYKENLAFITFTEHFQKYRLNVPQILFKNLDENIYLIEDLGDITLFDKIKDLKKTDSKNDIIDFYKKVIIELPKFQIAAATDFNYSYCYPRSKFDKQSMMWDLNYFKYYFLKLAQVPFDEQMLEEDFNRFTEYLLTETSNYFLYRDFQSRNIMLVKDKPFFIDYQGGRKGALQYDIASLLYDAKADLSEETKTKLLELYLEEISKYIKIDNEKFKSYYSGYVLIRMLQALGAYGFRGFYEKKSHFLQSIPYAVKNLNDLIRNSGFNFKTNVLFDVLLKISESDIIKKIINTQQLQIEINSFSYKKGIPNDESGHGGGFVFDCRALPNPGRLDEYKNLTGKDAEVITYFQNQKIIDNFLTDVMNILSITIDNYIERNFKNLSINFGCTGGIHRSVYCAEKISSLITGKYNIHCNVSHTSLM